ncbi:hypothetical protein Tco_0550656 [Tanacetum coccineum]
MKDVFVSLENDLDETFKQNELLKDRLLEASLAKDIKNLVITSYVEIRNKDLHDEIKRISKETKDVSNESKTANTVETNQCDKVKVKDDFDEIETRNIELEHRVASLIKENEYLKLTYKSLFDSIKNLRVQTKTSNVTQNEAENLKSQLFEFTETKFNAVKLELSNKTAKFEVYYEKLEKTKVVLERQLARKVDDSKVEKDQILKEINHLRTQLENLKGKSMKTKFDKHSILGKPPADKLLINSQISKSWFTPKVDVQKSLSKPITTQS